MERWEKIHKILSLSIKEHLIEFIPQSLKQEEGKVVIGGMWRITWKDGMISYYISLKEAKNKITEFTSGKPVSRREQECPYGGY